MNEIFVLDPDGGAPLQLTDNNVFDGNPDWSPDGTRIVFDGVDDEGVLQVYTMAVDAPSTTATQLTTGAANGKAVWSPDGERIAFLSLRDDQREIYVMAADGSAQVNLTNDPSGDALAAWSADGARLAFVCTRWPETGPMFATSLSIRRGITFRTGRHRRMSDKADRRADCRLRAPSRRARSHTDHSICALSPLAGLRPKRVPP